MKTLILLRHAKSSWDDPELQDADRPLNKRGKRDAAALGERLAARSLAPDIVAVSPARRARATIEPLRARALAAGARIVEDERLYAASASAILSVVQGLDDASDRAMIVGHNPGLTDFANRFAACSIDNIPTCGIVAIDYDAASWAQAGAAPGRLVVFDAPKKTG